MNPAIRVQISVEPYFLSRHLVKGHHRPDDMTDSFIPLINSASDERFSKLQITSSTMVTVFYHFGRPMLRRTQSKSGIVVISHIIIPV